jgi:hypothetical protein
MNIGWRLQDGLVATRTAWTPPQGGTVGGPPPPNNTLPVYLYWHTSLPIYVPDPGVPSTLRGNSVSGGFVYRGPVAALDGYYFFGDFSPGRLWSFIYDGISPSQFDGDNTLDFINWNSPENTLTFTGGASSLNELAGFGEDQAGNVYLVRYNGEILRIADAAITFNVDQLSLYGDVDIDGDVDNDDIADFLAGWMKTASIGVASWKQGDFDLNGKTDLPDVYLMHQALVAQGSAFPFDRLFVPEPAAGMLAIVLYVFGMLSKVRGRGLAYLRQRRLL